MVHCDWHTQKLICANLQAFSNTFPLFKLTFLHFSSGGVKETAKISHFVDFDWEKMHPNGMSSVYLEFKACLIQCHRFQVSAISSSWKITISGKNFTFCWFWLGKMHQNCLSGMYIGFKACWIQWHLLQVSIISSSWKITILGDTEHKMGLKTSKWDGTYAAVLFGSYFTPVPCFRTLYLDLPVKNAEKP